MPVYFFKQNLSFIHLYGYGNFQAVLGLFFLAQISLFSPYFANIWVIQLKKILAARLLNNGSLFFKEKFHHARLFGLVAYSERDSISSMFLTNQII